MSNRRKFIQTTLTGIAGISLLPAVNTYAAASGYKRPAGKMKLRFALASDAHYGQEGTEYEANFSNMMKWLNADHDANHLDMVIINGDLVHNRPDLLPLVKSKFLDTLKAPYYTIPGNHDFADGKIWKSVFGYDDKYTVDHGDVGFVFANTADTKGAYVCPDNQFIKTALEGFKDKKIVFVILHIAPVIWLESEKLTFTDCPETVKLLHEYKNVKAVFHGHEHTLDSVRHTGLLPHFFDSHIGGNWGTDYRGYRVVEVSADNEIHTYQVNASQNPRLNSDKI